MLPLSIISQVWERLSHRFCNVSPSPLSSEQSCTCAKFFFVFLKILCARRCAKCWHELAHFFLNKLAHLIILIVLGYSGLIIWIRKQVQGGKVTWGFQRIFCGIALISIELGTWKPGWMIDLPLVGDWMVWSSLLWNHICILSSHFTHLCDPMQHI